MSPNGEMATDVGSRKLAVVPIPLALPDKVVPAIVVTVAGASVKKRIRMTLLALSTIKEKVSSWERVRL
jgi:hypothetical protein